MHFAESWVHSAAGHEAEASEAQSKVRSYTRDYQYRANIALHGALCTVVQGGIDEGVRQAAATIDGLPAAYRSTHVLATGHMVLQAVPLEQRTRPPIAEFQEVLASEQG